MLKIQVAQAKVDSTMAVKQRELDLQSQEIMMSQMKDQAKAQNDSGKLQIESYKVELDETVQSFMMQIEGHRVGLEEARVMIEQQSSVLDSQRVQLEQAALQIEQFKAEMQARESVMEEIRLARESEAAEYASAVETMKNTAPAEAPAPHIVQVQPPAMPPMNIIIDAKQGKRPSSKKVSVVRDKDGYTTGYDVTEDSGEEED